MDAANPPTVLIPRFFSPPCRVSTSVSFSYSPRLKALLGWGLGGKTKREIAMKYKLLGKSGLRVSELCLGTMTFGEDWGWGASKDESRAVFEAFTAAGGNFLDTANIYTNGSSETITGELIGSDRDRFVLATKFTLPDNPGSPANVGNPNAGGNHRKNLMRSVEGSLKRLNTDYIDLLWLHAWDLMTPVDEVMRGLDDLVSAGKVNYVGISDTPAWIVSQANTLAELRGWTPFVALQIELQPPRAHGGTGFDPNGKSVRPDCHALVATGAGRFDGQVQWRRQRRRRAAKRRRLRPAFEA